MTSLQSLFSSEVIPVQSRLSQRQELLADHLAGRMKKILPEGKEFISLILKAISPDGDCSGLASLSLEGHSLMAVFTGAEIRFASVESRDASPSLNAAHDIIDRLDSEILRLAKDPDWLELKKPPRSVKNRFLYFQYTTFSFPAYRLLVPLLQRGMCAKRAQLIRLQNEIADRRMGGFLQPVMHILRHIPPEAVRPSLDDYAPGELDEIVWSVIENLPRKVAGPFHRTVYTHATRVTYLNNWLEAFYSKAGKHPFQSRVFSRRGACPVLDLADFDDELLEKDPSHLKFQMIMADQQTREESEIGIEHSAPGPKSKSKSLCTLSSDAIAIQMTPSASMPGSQPLVVLAMIRAFLDAIPEHEPEINILSRWFLVQCILHFGRHPEWLLDLQTGKRPGSIRALSQPVVVPEEYCIYHRPELYLGIPARLTPPHGDDDGKWNRFSAEWENHNLVYEDLSLIREIRIPAPLRPGFDALLKERKKAIQKLHDTELELDTGPFWIWQDGDKLVPLSPVHVRGIFRDLTGHVRHFIPDFPNLHPSHLCRTFEGWFADLGVGDVHRYYISDRLFPQSEMPIRYSHVPVRDIESLHGAASSKLEELIQREMVCLGLSKVSSATAQNRTAEEDSTPSAAVGSWRCARVDTVQAAVRELREAADNPDVWYPGIPHPKAEINKQTRLLAVCLSLLNGVRPRELFDLRARNIDLKGLRISIHGKPHQKRSAYRCLPILPEIGDLLKFVLQGRNGDQHPHRRIIGFYSEQGQWKSGTVKDLNGILTFAGNRQGYRFMPDFYSLRHRFRTDWLELGAPEFILNYLMGHEAKGFEYFGIHQDARLEGVELLYREYAGRLAKRYGVFQ
jgi:hypothetical protein